MLDEVEIEINETGTERLNITEEIKTTVTERLEEPHKKFENEFSLSIEILSANQGLGTVYGTPRRSTQEKIRAEMTKCENSQNRIDKLIEKVINLSLEYNDNLINRNPTLSYDFRVY